jgi:hypothetical protein
MKLAYTHSLSSQRRSHWFKVIVTAVRVMDAKVANCSISFIEHEDVRSHAEYISQCRAAGRLSGELCSKRRDVHRQLIELPFFALDSHGDKGPLSQRLRGRTRACFGGCAAGGHQSVGARSKVALLELFVSHIIASEFHPFHRNTTTPRLAFCPPRYSWLSNSHDRSHSQDRCTGLEARARSRSGQWRCCSLAVVFPDDYVSKSQAPKLHAFETASVAKQFRHDLLRPTYPP